MNSESRLQRGQCRRTTSRRCRHAGTASSKRRSAPWKTRLRRKSSDGRASPCSRAPATILCLTYILPHDNDREYRMETTKLSSKGQIILPASIRSAHQWQAGVEFAVESTADGVLLRPIKSVATTTLDEVIGCAGYAGEAHSIEEMDAAITAEIKARHARD